MTNATDRELLEAAARAAGFEIGSLVRVKDPDIYISEKAKKVRDRDGTIDSLATDGVAFVRFHKRNGRGKEFRDRIRLNNLVLSAALAPKEAA